MPALVYNVPGAEPGWYWVAGLGAASAFHPHIPVAHPKAERYIEVQKERVAEARRAWDKHEAKMEADGHRLHGRLPWQDPGIPVKLVWVSEKQAEEGRAAYESALRQATPVRGNEE